MKLIETKTLVSAAASIEFTSIPQTFTDLVVVGSLRTTASAAAWSVAIIRPNGSSTDGSYRALFGDGSSTGSFTSGVPAELITTSSLATANTFGNSTVYIPNYTSAQNKSFSTDGVSENNATSSLQMLLAGLWSQTAAITSLTIVGTGDLVAGSTISLYGILKGSDGIVTTS